jgi:ribosomal protein L29
MAEAEQLKKEVREIELELARLRATFPLSEVRARSLRHLRDPEVRRG